jgi:hypothetical protein
MVLISCVNIDEVLLVVLIQFKFENLNRYVIQRSLRLNIREIYEMDCALVNVKQRVKPLLFGL